MGREGREGRGWVCRRARAVRRASAAGVRLAWAGRGRGRGRAVRAGQEGRWATDRRGWEGREGRLVWAGRLAWGDREGRWAVRVRWEDRGREGCRDLAGLGLAGLAEGRWTLGCEGALVLALVREALVLAAPVLVVPAPAALAAAVRCLRSWLARSSS